MNNSVKNKVLEEIELIPEERLAELYSFIYYFRLGLEKAQTGKKEDILKFAGCWRDMPEEQLAEFTDELTQRRRQAFSQRRRE